MAYRAQAPLEDVVVEFRVADGRVHETVRLRGPLTDKHLPRLRHAVDFCPVGKMLTKGVLHVEDEMIPAGSSSGDRFANALPDQSPSVRGATLSDQRAAAGEGSPPSEPLRTDGALAAGSPLPPGFVRSRHLRETIERGPGGELVHEGEVELYLAPDGLPRSAVLSGHSSAGWMPAPVPLLFGALAASTVATLQRNSDSGELRVEIIRQGVSASKDERQADAAAGVAGAESILRRVIVSEPASVEAALALDPISVWFRDTVPGLSQEIVVE